VVVLEVGRSETVETEDSDEADREDDERDKGGNRFTFRRVGFEADGPLFGERVLIVLFSGTGSVLC
jgi:hypothetical protein